MKAKKKGKVVEIRPGKEVVNLAESIKNDLRKYSARIKIAGSIRRKKPAPFDIDILIVPRTTKSKIHITEYLANRGELLDHGLRRVSSRIKGIRVDVYFTTRDSWGASLMYLTGPGGANIYNRRLAMRLGYMLNQYGLFNRRTGKRVPVYSEKEIYNALGKTYRNPIERGKKRTKKR